MTAKAERVCAVCGKPVPEGTGVPWLAGIAHDVCKRKEEKRMQEGSDTIFGKGDKPL